MPDEGSEKYTGLTKGAFDVDAVNHGSNWQTDLKTFATESFDTGVKGIFARLGLTDQIISKLGSVGSSDFVENMWTVGSDLVSAGIRSVLGDGLALIFDAGKTGFDIFTKSGSKRDFNFQKGEWVIIDNGPVKKTETAFSGTPGKHELRRRLGFAFEGERDVSAGFYIGQGKEENTITVFNFGLFREQDVSITAVNRMAKGESTKLDKDELISEIRKLKFQQDECSQINSKVPTDPGTEVLLDDVRYHVVTSTGQTVTIEDEWGWQSIVDISLLKRGRVTRTQVFNYKTDGSVTGGFLGSGEDSIYAGRWLWVSARELGYPAAKELVCVQFVHNKIHCFYALDGEKGKFDESEVELVSDEFNAMFAQNKSFAEFKGFALAGYDMKRVSLGKTYPLVCIGVTGSDQDLTKTAMKDVEACDTVYSRLEKAIARVGDLNLHKDIDNAEERGQKDQAANRVAYEVLDELEGEPDTGGDSAYGFMMVGGVGLVALLLMNSVG